MAERQWNGEMPPRMRELPVDSVGRPVPWFASWIDGKPEFRVADGGKLRRALRVGLCWVCGQGFSGGEDRAWLIGPMCVITCTTAEPPCHLDCAVFSARNCPFLFTPAMVRRERHIPEGTQEPAGIMIRRNPGASVVWVTRCRDWRVEREDPGTPPSLRELAVNPRSRRQPKTTFTATEAFKAASDGRGILFRLGPARRALWFAEGREATRAEVLASVDSGLPLLREMAEQDGPEAVAELERMHAAALAYLPPEQTAAVS